MASIWERIYQVPGNSQFKISQAGAYLVYLRNSEAACIWRGVNVGEIGNAIRGLMWSKSLVMTLASV